MSLSRMTAQNPAHFFYTQKLWNKAWHSDDGCSPNSVIAKVICIVFPIFLSVAIVEAVQWAWSVFKIASDPKDMPLNPQSVKKTLLEVESTFQKKPALVAEDTEGAEQPLPEVLPLPSEQPAVIAEDTETAEQPLPEVLPLPSEQPAVIAEDTEAVEQPLPEMVFIPGPNLGFQFLQMNGQAYAAEWQKKFVQEMEKHILSMGGVSNFINSMPQFLTLVEGSSQHDIVDNEFDPDNLRPPACAYHALQAAKQISWDFDLWNQHFEVNRVRYGSQMQRQIIKKGTQNYFDAVKRDPALKEAADLENIKIKDPDILACLHLHLEPANPGLQSIEEKANAIVEHLFVARDQPRRGEDRPIVQIALLKNTYNEHMALVCAKSKTIFFNSHYNVMLMTSGKQATKAQLVSMMEEVGDLLPFSYTLGQCNTTNK